jgi:hypothetical protein
MACKAGDESANVSAMRVKRETTSSGVKLRRSHASQSARYFSSPVQSLSLKCVATCARQGSFSVALFNASG